VKLPRVLTQRPAPRMPELVGFEPRFDAIPTLRVHKPAEVVRPLYWWAKDLRTSGDVLVDARFDAAMMAASVTVRLASYQVVEVVRRHDDKPRLPHDLAALIAEGVWRLGSLGWTDELEEMIGLLRTLGLTATPAVVKPSTRHIPGWVHQPDRAVRIAYWWSVALKRHGWKLYACGDAVAQHGFIAEIPCGGADPVLVVYPGGMPADGTEASALANHLARLGTSQRKYVQRVIGDAAAGKGRVV
jgi:hypothetical protein